MSMWRCVGCRRGSLESQMQDIPLCNPPTKDLQDVSISQTLFTDKDSQIRLRKANACLQRAIAKRAKETMAKHSLVGGEWVVAEVSQIGHGEKASHNRDSFLHHLRRRWSELALVRVDQISSVGHPFPPHFYLSMDGS